MLFEAQGFGSRTGDIRWWYVAGLGLGLALSIGVPFVILRLILPAWARDAWRYEVGALILAFALFGVSLTR
ncbi:MAG: hypothetical protein M3135_04225 [Actinomycetota bacterium]|nr:hypothetical protein [Actinomycetota bacterium]